MASFLRGIADALADGLDAVSWSIGETTVERRNWVSIDVESMGTPRVFVVPGNATMSRVSRDVMQIECAINVFIGRHVTTDSEVDGMLDLADEVLLYVRAHDFPSVSFPAGVTSPQTVTIDINPDDAMAERNVWRAVVTATYIVFESNVLPTPEPTP